MPLPTPRKDEEKNDFISRCMGDETMKREYPKEEQRQAVCQNQWKRKEEAVIEIDDFEAGCAAAHMGPWMIEIGWFAEALSAVRAGLFAVQAASKPAERPPYVLAGGGVAQIGIHGQMMKTDSKFGGANTVRVRRSLRSAAADPAVRAIALHVDSPGGTVDGTADLAADVREINRKKPVHAYIEDLGASAAYWVASQAAKVYANATARVGSIGVVAIVEDHSARAEKLGIKVHVVSTGQYKGAFVPGTEVTDDQLAYAQDLVNGINEHFLSAIKQGRRLPIADVRKLADGRVHLAAQAQELGLIDGIQSYSETLTGLAREVEPEKKAAPAFGAVDRRIRLTEALSAEPQGASGAGAARRAAQADVPAPEKERTAP